MKYQLNDGSCKMANINFFGLKETPIHLQTVNVVSLKKTKVKMRNFCTRAIPIQMVLMIWMMTIAKEATTWNSIELFNEIENICLIFCSVIFF